MAALGSNLTNGVYAGSNSSQATASITPTANALIIATLTVTNPNNPPNNPTVSGNGLTWVQIATVTSAVSGGGTRQTQYRAMGASPSTGAITIDLAGQSFNELRWSIDQFAGVDTSGTNGSGAVVQSATNTQTGNNSSFSITLGAFSNVANVTYGTCGMNDFSPGITVGPAFAQLSNITGDHMAVAEWASSNQTNVLFTYSTANRTFIGIGVEIKAAPAAGGAFLFNML